MKTLRPIALAIALCASASAQTTTYTYDALGRLVKSDQTTETSVLQYAYDLADNRTSVKTRAAPTAVIDHATEMLLHGSTWTGVIFPLSNDTDTDLPDDTLTVTALSGSSYAAIGGGGTEIDVTAIPTGTYTLSYTISDTYGVTSSNIIILQVIKCNPTCIIPP